KRRAPSGSQGDRLLGARPRPLDFSPARVRFAEPRQESLLDMNPGAMLVEDRETALQGERRLVPLLAEEIRAAEIPVGEHLRVVEAGAFVDLKLLARVDERRSSIACRDAESRVKRMHVGMELELTAFARERKQPLELGSR